MRYKVSLFVAAVLVAVSFAGPAKADIYYHHWIFPQSTVNNTSDSFGILGCGEAYAVGPGQVVSLTGPQWYRWSIAVVFGWDHWHGFSGATFYNDSDSSVYTIDGRHHGYPLLTSRSQFNPAWGRRFVTFANWSQHLTLVFRKRCV